MQYLSSVSDYKQLIIIDYLVFTIKDHTVFDYYLDYFHIDFFKLTDGYSFYGLKHCYKYIYGIKFHVDEDRDLFILDFSGSGCRLAETLKEGDDWSWLDLFAELMPDIRSKVCHVSRLDVACDLYDNYYITLSNLAKYVNMRKFLCKSKHNLITHGTREDAIYFGSPKSDRRLRIYDKALEQGIADQRWVRFEFQLRNDCALSFLLNLEACAYEIVDCYYGIMRDYLVFTTCVNTGCHKDRLRLSVTDWWDKFLQGKDALRQLYLPRDDYTLTNLKRFLYNTAGSSLKLALMLYAGDPDIIFSAADKAKLNPRQLALLERFDLEQHRCSKVRDLIG